MAVLFTGAVFTMGAVGTVPNGRVRKYDFLYEKKKVTFFDLSKLVWKIWSRIE